MSFDELTSQVKTLWKFDYEPKIKALRELYEVAKKQQWNAATDIDWSLEIDRDGDILDPRQNMMSQFDFVKALPDRTRKDLQIRLAAWRLSQFLHGEQGALLCCGQLVDVVPDTDGKLYAATQVVDEARHVEVFHRYITRLDRVYPIDPQLQAVLNAILAADTWQKKCVGMQIIVESLAMGSFKLMKEGSKDELLRKVVELTAQDEARHVSYGTMHLKYFLEHHPNRQEAEDELHVVADSFERGFATFLVNPWIVEPLAVLAGGGIKHIDRGMEAVKLVWRRIVDEYLNRCDLAGFDRRSRIKLPDEPPY